MGGGDGKVAPDYARDSAGNKTAATAPRAASRRQRLGAFKSLQRDDLSARAVRYQGCDLVPGRVKRRQACAIRKASFIDDHGLAKRLESTGKSQFSVFDRANRQLDCQRRSE